MTPLKFIHIPKTAGTSIRSAMPERTRSRHRPISTYTEEAHYFTCVRNPYDRALSMHAFFSQLHLKARVNPQLTLLNIWTRTHPSPSAFWESLTPEVHRTLQENNTFLAPQVYYLKETPLSTEIAPRIKTTLRFETLQADWRALTIHHHLKLLEHKNKSDHPHWKTTLTPAAKEKIKAIYTEDFRLLKYPT